MNPDKTNTGLTRTFRPSFTIFGNSEGSYDVSKFVSADALLAYERLAARCQALPGSICSGDETVAELSYLRINAEQASSDVAMAICESAACVMVAV